MIAELYSQLCYSTAVANCIEIYTQVLHSSVSISLSIDVHLNHLGSPEEVLCWTLLPEIFGLVGGPASSGQIMGSCFFFFFLTLQIVMCWIGNRLFIRRQNYKLALEFFHSFLKLFFFPCILKRYHPLRTDNDP